MRIIPSKPFLISGLTSSALTGAGLIGALLSVEEAKITFKEKLKKQGYIEIETNKFGPKLELLKQYEDFPKGITNLPNWCKEQEKIAEKGNDETSVKLFKEFCFETIASRIHGTDRLILILNKEEPEEFKQEWTEKFTKFKNDYESNASLIPLSRWTKSEKLEDFQQQCKTKERIKFADEKDEIFQGVKEYCTRNFVSQHN